MTSPHDSVLSGHCILGLWMSQREGVLSAFSVMLQGMKDCGWPPVRIIELGTAGGALTIFLSLYAAQVSAEVFTFDSGDVCNNKVLFDRLKIKYFPHVDVLADCHKKFIGGLIAQPGVTLLLCDNGCKAMEVNMYAPFLKFGDVIMAHDYVCCTREFNDVFLDKIWNWHQLSDADVEAVCVAEHLVPFYQDVFAPYVWMCRRKG